MKENVTRKRIVTADAELEFSSMDSVEIKKGAKGDISFSVKCYGNTIEEAEEKATRIFDMLSKRYQEGV